MPNKTLSGLIAAPHTPFHPHGNVRYETIERQAQLLSNNGVSGAFICGTTGEGASLTTEERMRVAERWREVQPEGFVTVVHVGHTSLGEASALARHAQEIGADAMAAVPPFYYKPPTVDALVAACAEIAAAAPQTPFYYYHIPGMTGVHFSMRAFLEAAADRIPTLAGIKYSDGDLMDFGRCADFDGGRFTMLFGSDEILLSALVAGASGAVGSTYNYASRLYLRVMDAYANGDMKTAEREQAKSREMVRIAFRYGGMATGKAMMSLVGVDCGGLRPPLQSLTQGEVASLKRDLDEIGFFEFASKL